MSVCSRPPQGTVARTAAQPPSPHSTSPPPSLAGTGAGHLGEALEQRRQSPHKGGSSRTVPEAAPEAQCCLGDESMAGQPAPAWPACSGREEPTPTEGPEGRQDPEAPYGTLSQERDHQVEAGAPPGQGAGARDPPWQDFILMRLMEKSVD